MPRSRRRAFFVPLLVVALAPPSALLGQPAPCGLGNARLWCADQSEGTIPGSPLDGDRFGSALAFGDLDGAGRDELAIGVEGEGEDGAVLVLYSDGLQLGVADNVFRTFFESGGEARLGAALACGDSVGFPTEDLAVGGPTFDFQLPKDERCGFDHECDDAGALRISVDNEFDMGSYGEGHWGGPGFYDEHTEMGRVRTFFDLDGNGTAELLHNYDKIVELREHGDNEELGGGLEGLGGADFGLAPEDQGTPESIVVGRLEGAAGPISVAVGVPEELGHGAVRLYFDVSSGGYPNTEEFRHLLVQPDFGSAGEANGDRFGASAAVGDFDGDGGLDLAVGAPNKSHGSGNPSDSGRVYVAYGPVDQGE
jgi:hypothetical protein